MSHLFLVKELNGSAVTFLRFEGPERFIVQIDGVEQPMSRVQWTSLPVRATADESLGVVSDNRHVAAAIERP